MRLLGAGFWWWQRWRWWWAAAAGSRHATHRGPLRGPNHLTLLPPPRPPKQNINIPNILNDTDFAGLLTYARLVGRRNLMTHLLAGSSECQWIDGAGQPSRTLGAAGTEPAALLSAAQARLGEFCWVGLQERMRESHALLAAALGVEGLQYQARYINRQKAHPAVPAAVRREIAALNHLDVALYNHGARLFQQRYEAVARSGLLSPP